MHLEDAINVGRRMSIDLRARGALVSHEEAKFLFRPHRPHDRKSHERQQNTGRVSRKNVGLDTPTTHYVILATDTDRKSADPVTSVEARNVICVRVIETNVVTAAW